MLYTPADVPFLNAWGILGFFVLCLVLPGVVWGASPATTQPVFVEFDAPPTILPDAAQLERLRAAYARKDEVGQALVKLVEVARTATTRAPQPIATLIYEGRVSNDPQRVRTVMHLRDMQTLHDFIWAYRLTEAPELAEAGIRYLMAWVETCRPSGNDVNDHKLMPILEAYGVWRDRLSPAQRKQVEDWLATLDQANRAGLAQDRQRGRGNTNRAAKRVKMLMCSAVLRQDAADIEKAVNEYRRHMADALRPDGRSVDLELRDAMPYHISEIGSLLEVALMARQAGHQLLDMASPQGASLRRSLDFVVPYARGEKTYANWVHSKIALDRKRWEAGDPKYQPGKPWDPAEGAEVFGLAALLDPQYESLARDLAQRPHAEVTPILRVLIQRSDTP